MTERRLDTSAELNSSRPGPNLTAISFTKDPTAVKRMKDAVTAIKKLEAGIKARTAEAADSMHAAGSKPLSQHWFGRLEKLVHQGYRPPPGSAGHLHLTAKEAMDTALVKLKGTGPDPRNPRAWRAQFGSPIL